MQLPRAQLGGRIFELESWLCKPRKEIRLGVYRHELVEAICDSSQKANAKTKTIIPVKLGTRTT